MQNRGFVKNLVEAINKKMQEGYTLYDDCMKVKSIKYDVLPDDVVGEFAVVVKMVYVFKSFNSISMNAIASVFGAYKSRQDIVDEIFDYAYLHKTGTPKIPINVLAKRISNKVADHAVTTTNK